MGYNDESVSLGRGSVRAATDKALQILLVDDDNRLVWIPRSVIHDDSEVFDSKDNATGEVVVKSWWAEKQGLS